MPAREFLNPYAALTQPNVAAGGFANLAAALASAPQERAEQEMRGRQMQSRDLFERTRLAQEDKRLADEQQHRQDSLGEERRYHDAEMQWRNDDLDVRKGANAEHERHNKAGETAATTRAFLGGAAGVGKTIAGVAGYGAPHGATKDPAAASLTAYGHATTVAKTMHGADGDPAQIKATADELYDTFQQQEGSQLLPRPQQKPQGRTVTMPGGVPPAPSVSGSWLRRSGQPGVHSLGDLTGGVVDGWSGPSANAAPVPAAPAPAAGGPTLRTSQMLSKVGQGPGMFPDLQSAVADAQQRGYQIVQDH